MSLVDLKSDLSKFRSNTPKPKSSNQQQIQSKYGDSFGAYTPISDSLSNDTTIINKPDSPDLIGKLAETRLDNVIKNTFEEMLINSVSEYSPKSIEYNFSSPSNTSLESIVSAFSKVNKDTKLSSIEKSNTNISRMDQGTNNNESNVEIIDDASETGNITNPNVVLNSIPLSMNREGQSVDIIKNESDATDNIKNPDINPGEIPLTYDRESQSVDIQKEFNAKQFIVNANSNKLISDSILNIDITPDKYNTTSEIVNKKISSVIDTTKYDGQISEIVNFNSILDFTKPTESVLSGRHETDKNSTLSNIKNESVDYFDNQNSSGFTKNIEPLTTEYVNNSSTLGYETLLEANYFDIKNDYTTDGFEAFTQQFDSKYIPGSSEFDWDGEKTNAPNSDYFDATKKNTTLGFHTFAQEYDTKYKVDSSRFTWLGKRTSAPTNNPSLNYFDLSGQFTTDGFHTFAQTKEETKYIPGSSEFDWDGDRSSAPTNKPSLNYFDLQSQFTNAGFHTFAQPLEETKYIPESSEFDWDGDRNSAPTNKPPLNYFDLQSQFTTAGFHTFAELYDSKFIPESSEFDWDGDRSSAPTNKAPLNYFDLQSQFTTAGFHTFAQPLEETKYIPESSEFDWDGDRNSAPTNNPPLNYFDLTGQFTTAGFHTFAQEYDSKYIPESSRFDWDGDRSSAPTNKPPLNYFDLTGQFTTDGFHTFAQTKEETKYIAESSQFDWDGPRSNAPTNNPPLNYFDLNAQFTTDGFHTFAQEYDTKYIPESSRFDWDGPRSNAPTNKPPLNYFDLTAQFTTDGFHTFAQTKEETKYIPESSQFDWDGPRSSAPTNDPPLNYFDLIAQFTTDGFHTFAQTKEETKYIPESSQFDWDGPRSNAPTNDPPLNYFDLTAQFTTDGFHTFAQTKEETKYIPESSQFDWDGPRSSAPTNAPPLNYFDLTAKFTTDGFHTFAQTKEDTKYIPESSEFDWDGPRSSAPTNAPPLNYFDLTGQFTTDGFHTFAQEYDSKYIPESSRFDWDGPRSSAPTNAPPLNYFDLTAQFTTDGFHTFAQTKEETKYIPESSQFDWDGDRSSAPANAFGFPNGYFDLNNISTSRGFHTFAAPLEQTSYQTTPGLNSISLTSTATVFDWDGIDPFSMSSTKFFGFTQTNPFGFVIGMNQFDGTTYPIIDPQFNSTILSLQGSPQRSQRLSLSTLRQTLEPLQTNNLEQFAPLTFAGKTISGFKATLNNQSPVVNVQKYGFNITGYRRRGKTLGQLVDQQVGSTFVINPAKVLPFMDVNRYTLGGSVDTQPTYVDGQMAVWANAGDVKAADQTFSTTGAATLSAADVVALNRSFNGLPYYNGVLYKSHIDYQYNKFNLVRDSYNTDLIYPQPFIDTSLNGDDRNILTALRMNTQIPSSVNLGITTLNLTPIKQVFNDALDLLDRSQGFDEGIVRGGLAKHTLRVILDTKRITKFLLSSKGLLWNAKQIGLQFMNPMVDSEPNLLGIPGIPGGVLGVNWTNIYNPLSVPLNVLGKNAIVGNKFTRHGILMYGEGSYEDIAVTRQKNTDDKTFDSFSSPGIFNRTSDYNRLVSLTKELLPDSYKPILLSGKLPTIDTSTRIDRLSTFFGGPDSILGLFGTTINRATHPYKAVNSTGYFPTEENIRDGKDREVFFSPTKANSPYSEFLKRQYTENQGINEEGIGGILLALKKYVSKTQSDGSATFLRSQGAPAPYGVQKITANRLQSAMFSQFKHPSQEERVEAITVQKLSDKRKLNTPLHINNDKSGDGPLYSYETAKYEELGGTIEEATDTSKLRDFRSKITVNNKTATFMTSPFVADFKNLNIENNFGFGAMGEPGNVRSEPYVSTVQYSSLLPSETGSGVTVATSTVKSNYKYAAYPTLKKEVIDKYTATLNAGSDTGPTTNIPKFRGDRIGIIDWKRSIQNLSSDYVYEKYKDGAQNVGDPVGSAKDLIQFYFSGVRLKGSEYNPTEAIVFRAYIDTIVDNHKPSWTPIKYIGRADPVYSYDGYERDINFGFTVHIGSRDELKASWRKLNMLASWTAPEYIEGGFMKAPVVRLNLGNLYRKFPGFLSSLTYTFDNTQTTWETAKLKEDQNLIDAKIRALTMPGALELPKTINVQCTFVTFNMYRPEWDCVFYSLFDDSAGNGGLETGLVPKDGNKVNYFRTFDDLPVDHPMNSGLCAIVPEPVEPPAEVTASVQPVKVVTASIVPPKPVEKCICPIRFCVDEDRYVTTETENSVLQLAIWMKEDEPLAKIKLIGHASKERFNGKLKKQSEIDGEKRYAYYNKELSRSRAITIKNLLINEFEIDPSRIESATGVGYSQMIKGIPPGDARNRRIEVVVTNQSTAGCTTIVNLDCPNNPSCPAAAPCKREDIGDKSEFFLVGPQYFTTQYTGSGAPTGSLLAISEQADGSGTWWYPNDGISWRTKWAGRTWRVRGYSKTNANTSRYKTPKKNSANNFATYLPWPNATGALTAEETGSGET